MRRDLFVILLGLFILAFLLQISGCQVFQLKDGTGLSWDALKLDKKQIRTVKNMLGRKNVWQWDGKIQRNQENGQRSLWLRSIPKGGVSMRLLVSANENNDVSIMPYLYFDEKLKLFVKEDIDGKMYLQTRGRFDKEPIFALNLPASEEITGLYELKPDLDFLLMDNSHINAVEMIMRSNTMALEFKTLPDSENGNGTDKVTLLVINDARDAVEASLIALNVKEYDVAA